MELTKPKVFSDPTGKFLIAIANVDSDYNQLMVAKTFRYFNYDNKPCRTLAHSEKLKGGVNSSIEKQKVLVKNLAKNVTSKQLEDRFAKYGTIISARVVIDENHKSLGYGFVLFEHEDSADDAKRGEFSSKRVTWNHLKSKPADLFYNASD